MDIFFSDPSQVPLPPDEVRILDSSLDPYPDGRRLRLTLEFTPFQKKPNGDIVISDNDGNPVAVTSFVEAVTPTLEMTLHLRHFDPGGQYTLSVTLFYTAEIVDQDDEPITRMPERVIVDQLIKKFKIGG
jgi:hypothetical protein